MRSVFLLLYGSKFYSIVQSIRKIKIVTCYWSSRAQSFVVSKGKSKTYADQCSFNFRLQPPLLFLATVSCSPFCYKLYDIAKFMPNVVKTHETKNYRTPKFVNLPNFNSRFPPENLLKTKISVTICRSFSSSYVANTSFLMVRKSKTNWIRMNGFYKFL